MPNLLVVEDDAAIGSVLESTLRLHGHQVCWCRDGRTALRKGNERKQGKHNNQGARGVHVTDPGKCGRME